MRRLVSLAIAILLVVSVGVNVAQAADILPCVDNQASITSPAIGASASLLSPVPAQTSGRRAPGAPQHCAVASPFAAAILAQRPTAPCCPPVPDTFTLPVDNGATGLSPTPPHGPPRA